MIYVLSDIHGNAKNFDAILQQICLQPEDTLYILGDVIDRHPDGIRILRKIMSMTNAKMLLGNHEYMMLEALKAPKNEISDSPWERNWPSKKIRLWYRNGGKVTHDYLKHIRKSIRAEIVAYLEALPINIDIEVNGIKYKLVHGTLLENYGTGYRSYRYNSPVEFAVWERLPVDASVPEGYTLILYSGRGHAFRLLLSKQIMRSKANVAQQKPKEPTGKLKFCLSVKSLIGHCCIS